MKTLSYVGILILIGIGAWRECEYRRERERYKNIQATEEYYKREIKIRDSVNERNILINDTLKDKYQKIISKPRKK